MPRTLADDFVPWKEGALRLHSDDGITYVVSVWRSRRWVEVIRDSATLCSHIVEIAGINKALNAPTIESAREVTS